MPYSIPPLLSNHLRHRLTAVAYALGLTLLLGQAQALVRYDLYRGNATQYLTNPPAIAPNFTNNVTQTYTIPGYNNGNPFINYDAQTNINNLISLANTNTSNPQFTSSQIWYPYNSFTLCDKSNYQNYGLSVASCNGQYQGYVGYTAVFLPIAGTYNFSATANDAVEIDYAQLSSSQALSDSLDYKNLTYTTTTPMRLSAGTGTYSDSDGTLNYNTSPSTNIAPKYSDTVPTPNTTAFSGKFLTITVTEPTYLALRMYWTNWGNASDFMVGWTTPTNSSYTTVPATNTCDPANPAGDCFPKFSITKTGPDYAKPSVAASTNPATTAASNYLNTYTIKVSVAQSTAGTPIAGDVTSPATTGGNTTTYGTTTVTDTLPDALSWDSTSTYTAPTGWTCSVSGKVVTCTTTNTLTAGNSYSITLNNLLIATGTAAGTSFTNSVTVSNPNMPTVPPATKTTKTILTQLTKTVSKTTALPGDTLHYCITAANQGGADLSNYTIKDYAPAQLKDIANITFTNNGAAVSGSTYDASQTTNPTTGIASSGLVSSPVTPAVTLVSGTQAVLCFDGTVM